MSLQALCGVHKVTVLVPSFVSGGGMSTRRKYAARPPDVPCRVMPLSVEDRVAFAREGVQVSHRVLFTVDPGLKEGYMLRWVNPVTKQPTLFTIVTPINPHGLPLWDVQATATSEKNLDITGVVS